MKIIIKARVKFLSVEEFVEVEVSEDVLLRDFNNDLAKQNLLGNYGDEASVEICGLRVESGEVFSCPTNK